MPAPFAKGVALPLPASVLTFHTHGGSARRALATIAAARAARILVFGMEGEGEAEALPLALGLIYCSKARAAEIPDQIFKETFFKLPVNWGENLVLQAAPGELQQAHRTAEQGAPA